MKFSLQNWPCTMVKNRGLGIAAAVALLCCPGYHRALAEGAATDGLGNIDHIIIIYQENWSFDGLYGSFPGANGLGDASHPSLDQKDRLTDRSLSTELGINNYNNASRTTPLQNTPPQPLNGSNAIDGRFPSNLYTLLPFQLATYVDPTMMTGDIVHRYWQEQLQINDGKNNYFITWSDNPGLVMSHYDATNLPEGLLAQQYTISDKFHHSAFGGSFLNHQFLIAAQAPVYPNAGGVNSGAIANLDLNGKLTLNALGKIAHDGSITPTSIDVAAGLSQSDISFTEPRVHFDKNYVVNTTFSVNLAPNFVPFPSGTPPVSLLPTLNDTHPNDANYTPTIGDRLDDAGVSWKWYSGGWNEALDSSPSNPTHYGMAGNTVDPLFQWHHQPFAYFTRYAPFVSVAVYNQCPPCYPGGLNPYSAARLQDEENFFTDVQNNNLPSVSFVKALGPNNEHPGYASLQMGQDHVAALVQAVQNQPDLWAHTAIFVTYDEHGGRWDHVRPHERDIWGPGVRVPCIVISPFAPMGYVDSVPRDTSSLLATIEDRFHLAPLNDRDGRAHSYKTLFNNLNIARYPFRYDSANNRITQDVMLTNLGRTAVDGPIQLVLNNLSSGSKLLNASGETTDKTPYIVLNNKHLRPNSSIKVTLAFSLPESGGITYSPLAAPDSGSR